MVYYNPNNLFLLYIFHVKIAMFTYAIKTLREGCTAAERKMPPMRPAAGREYAAALIRAVCGADYKNEKKRKIKVETTDKEGK